MTGMLWVDVYPRGRQAVVVGLVVRNGWVVDGPPYARARGWMNRTLMSVEAELARLGARCIRITAPAMFGTGAGGVAAVRGGAAPGTG